MQSKGFTLIELLVVMAIIGVLASVTLASLNSARAKANDAKRLGDIRSVQNALELYYNDNGNYPPARDSDGDERMDGQGGTLAHMMAVDLVPYITVVNDPGTTNYGYVRRQNPNGYGIRIRFELRSGTDASGYCKTGVNILPAWWGATTPTC
jgi:type II secretion system protein G